MFKITPQINLHEYEIKFTFVTSPGPGGQNVNKVATAVQLRFDIVHSPSLPETVRARLISLLRKRVTTRGELIIKASRYRTQERNKQDALDRLCELIKRAAIPLKKRKKTTPTLASKQRRLSNKKRQGVKKTLRQNKLAID